MWWTEPIIRPEHTRHEFVGGWGGVLLCYSWNVHKANCSLKVIMMFEKRSFT